MNIGSKRWFTSALVGVFGFAGVGCALEVVPEEDVAEIQVDGLPAAVRARPRPQAWVDGELFAGVVTPANFSPESDPFDELYAADNPVGFGDGVPLISESGPGDQDFNGGRWHLNVLKGSVDMNKYAGARSVMDLDLADFMSTDMYFECPLLPRRGMGGGQ